MADDTESSADEPTQTDERVRQGTTVGAVLAAFGILFLFRTNAYPSVFRDDLVISPLNDPYHYRYWVNELLAVSSGGFDTAVLTEVGRTRPGTYASNWLLTELLGGTPGAADTVAAWLPVVGALGLGLLCFATALLLTRDIRVGIAAAVMLAFIPIHAVYSGIGFLEHRLHQYFWLGVIVTGIVWLTVAFEDSTDESIVDELSDWQLWAVAAVIGIAVGISAHLWGGSPLVIAPLAAYVFARVPLDIRAGVSPLSRNAPLAVALGIGAVISYGLHSRFGWHESFAALTPAFVFGIALVVVLVGELWQRVALPDVLLLPVEGVVVAAGTIVVFNSYPEVVDRFRDRSEDLFGREGIAEVVSLFDPNIFFGPLFRLGLVFYIAVPVLLWATLLVVRRYEPGWLAVVLYTWYWLVLAAIQNRFAGQLSFFVAVLAGFGVIFGLSYLGAARPVARQPTTGLAAAIENATDREGTRSDRSTEDEERIRQLDRPRTRRGFLSLGGVAAVLGFSGALLVDEQTARAAYTDEEYRTMRAIRAHAAETDQSGSAFVLSQWSHNRFYNYFLSGDARSYGSARANYPDFVAEENPDEWARNTGTDYIVLRADEGDLPPGTAHHMLMRRLGVAMEYRDPLAQFQLVHIEAEGTAPEDWQMAAFAVVPGARLTGTAEPGETVVAETEISVGPLTFPYAQSDTADENGEFEITVPYPGSYTVDGRSVGVGVDQEAIHNGEAVSVPDPQ